MCTFISDNTKRLSWLLLCLLTLATLPGKADDRRIVCDEQCRVAYQKGETGATFAPLQQEAGYAVVSPVGLSSVTPVQQAPRLTTMAGKRIAVVGVSFMTEVTHPEIKRLILQHYPTAQVFLLDEVGYAGPYPAPGIRRKQTEAFQAKLRELRIDAVISGNGGCGLCTPKETGSCIAAEVIGIPSVLIAGPGFTDQARYTALNNGIPVLRIAEYPGAFAADDKATLIRRTDDILWPQLVKGLTTPLSADEAAASEQAGHGDCRSDVFFGTLDEVHAYFAEQEWTDGLPFVPPTYDKVNTFLRYTPYRWDDTLAVLPPANRITTTWQVAVNAVMAGCQPEYMPILVAITQGLGDPSFRRTLSSTHAWMPFCWINGPIAQALGIDSGQGEINEAANMAIGRFMNLALMNLCGYYIKKDRMGSFGYPMPWCLVEDEAACKRVGWAPYHVRNGFAADESVVTLGSALLWGNNMAPSTIDPEKVMQLMAWDIAERGQFALGSGKPFTNRTILLTEPVATILSANYHSPEALEEDLITNSYRPLKERAFANYYANPGGRKDGGEHNLKKYTAHLSKTEHATMRPTPEWNDTQEKQLLQVPTMQRGMTAILITGDAARNKVQIMPGGGFVSIKIKQTNTK